MSEPSKSEETTSLAPAAPAQPGTDAPAAKPTNAAKEFAKEFGGPKGPEPTRYGDWEKNGRCIDF